MNATRDLRIWASLVVPVLAGAAANRIPLPVSYPIPVFDGTPKPITLSNVDPALARAPEFLVPPQTVLLSRGKPVSSSDPLPVFGELPFLTDGDKTGIDGTVVELGPGLQWVQIDLGAPSTIHAIAVWHFHSQRRVYHDVIVQISSDAVFARGVTTVFNSDQDGSSKLGRGRDRSYIESNFGRLIDGQGATGRYVRLYSNGNTSDELNHYCEVEVFGVSSPRAARGG
jgi:hypothetical protein